MLDEWSSDARAETAVVVAADGSVIELSPLAAACLGVLSDTTSIDALIANPLGCSISVHAKQIVANPSAGYIQLDVRANIKGCRYPYQRALLVPVHRAGHRYVLIRLRPLSQRELVSLGDRLANHYCDHLEGAVEDAERSVHALVALGLDLKLAEPHLLQPTKLQ